MPRSFFFFAVIAVFVARYHAADAAKMKNKDNVTCVCTKSPSNDVKIKVARCDIGTYYTACCNKAHPLFKGHCTYMAPSKSAVKSDKKPVLGSGVGSIQTGPGDSCQITGRPRPNYDCNYDKGCCYQDRSMKSGICATLVWQVAYQINKCCLGSKCQ